MSTIEDLRSRVRAADHLRATGARQLRSVAADAARLGLGLRESARALGRSHPEIKRLRTSVAAQDHSGAPRRWMTARTTVEAVQEELSAGDELMAFKMVVQGCDHLARLDNPDDVEEWAVTPMPIPDARYDTLLRALTARTMRAKKLPVPTWARDIAPLTPPWLVLGLEHRRERTVAATPEDLAALGIWVTENDLVTL